MSPILYSVEQPKAKLKDGRDPLALKVGAALAKETKARGGNEEAPPKFNNFNDLKNENPLTFLQVEVENKDSVASEIETRKNDRNDTFYYWIRLLDIYNKKDVKYWLI